MSTDDTRRDQETPVHDDDTPALATPDERDGETQVLTTDDAAPGGDDETQVLPAHDAADAVDETLALPAHDATDPVDETQVLPPHADTAPLLTKQPAPTAQLPTAPSSPTPTTAAPAASGPAATGPAQHEPAPPVAAPAVAPPPVPAAPSPDPVRADDGAPATAPRPRLRVGTVVWGLVLAAIGVGLLAWAAGLSIDVQLALIVLLAGAGGLLLVGSIVSAVRTSRR